MEFGCRALALVATDQLNIEVIPQAQPKCSIHAAQLCSLAVVMRGFMQHVCVSLCNEPQTQDPTTRTLLFTRCNDNDNDNDNDTLREVPHLSDEGLALQARASGPWPHEKESVLQVKLAPWQGVQVQTVVDRVYCTMVNTKFKEEKGHVLAQAVAVLNSQ